MAARSPTVESRRFASPAMKALMTQRAAEFGGLLLGLAGLVVLVALATYDPRDPSLNTATSRHVSNLAGPGGAVLSDFLLQGFGIVGVLPGITMLTWAWRIGSRRGLSSFPLRLVALILGVPLLAAVLSTLPIPHVAHWPVMAGLGGSFGQIIGAIGLRAGDSLFGLLGQACIWMLATMLSVLLVLMALGLSWSEWRGAGRVIGMAARFSVSGGRSAVGGVSNASGWLVNLVNRGPGLEPEEPEKPEEASPRPRPVVRVPERAEPRLSPPEPRVVPAEEPTPVTDLAIPPIRTVRPPPQPPPPRKVLQSSLPLAEGNWQLPPMSLLKEAPTRAASGPSEEALQANARLLETVLSDYGVQGEIVEIRPGPVVTLYELVPAPGIRSARVIGLADDVARSLSVTAVRIATVPGRNVIGIEVPNSKRETVFLSEILTSEEFQRSQSRLSLALGKDISGRAIFADLARM
jgi:S-DNA-T family DNA segregation ATPase FtsK/SpoIIIE